MYNSILAVALRTVRHNDRTSILTAWSPSQGRLSLVMPAGNGVESRRRRAVTMPLGLFEGVISAARSGTLSRIRDVRTWGPDGYQPDVSSHPVRAAVAMFVAETLSVVTREGDADQLLWQIIIETASLVADAPPTALANVPIMFLLRILRPLGIEPDWHDYVRGKGFDAVDGVFRASAPAHKNWLSGNQARIGAILARAAEGYIHVGLPRLDRSTRNAVLNELIDYFSLHHFPLNRLRSPAVLHALFS